ncbi:MAG: tetratricopeptide repeat protein [Nitrospirota bacterium]
MIDTAYIHEYWWAGFAALAGILALLVFIGIYRSKRKLAAKEPSAGIMPEKVEREEPLKHEELKKEMEALLQKTEKLEKALQDKTSQITAGINAQIRILEKAFAEQTAAPLPQSSDRDRKRDERLLDNIRMLFPQFTLLDQLEQFRQLSLPQDEVRKIISDIVKRTDLVPWPVDFPVNTREARVPGSFEKGVLTLLSHRINDIEKHFHTAVAEETVYLILGNMQYEEGEYLRAKDYYEKALRKNPSDGLLLYNLAVVFIQQGNYHEALGFLERALDADPRNARAWYARGIALGRIDQHEEALTAFGNTLELNQHSARAWHSTGVVLARLGRHEEALKSYENALELEPDLADAWYNKGVTLIQLGLHEKALKAYENAIRMMPGSADAWYNKGIALGRLGRYEEALRAYEKTLDLRPDFADAWYTKACLYALQGDKKSALADLSKAIMINPACRETAKGDEDFRNLLQDEDFQKVVA